MNNKISIIGVLFWIVLFFSLLSVGCNSYRGSLLRLPQSDTEPPTFSNLAFPPENATLADGRLMITGTLTDETELDPDTPLVLEIEVIGSNNQSRGVFDYSVHYADSSYLSYIDEQTGAFRINFHDAMRIKHGKYNLKLTGYDASRNTVQAESEILMAPVTGLNPEDLGWSRYAYGQQLVSFLSNFKSILAVYGEEYEYETKVIDLITGYIDDTYLTNQNEDAWIGPMEELIDDIEEVSYPGNSTFKALIDNEVMPELLRMLESDLERSSTPFYKRWYTTSDIVQSWNEMIDRMNSLVISSNVETLPDETISCHVTVYGTPAWTNEQLLLAEFTMYASEEHELLIDGFIGPPDKIIEIQPDDYSPPLKLFGLFYEANLIHDCLIQF